MRDVVRTITDPSKLIMKTVYSLMFFVTLLIVACNGDSDVQSEIKLADNVPTSIVLNADEYEETIEFTTNDDWAASITSETDESVSWIGLSPDKGNAGDNKIIIRLEQNFTGIARKANLVITCGESSVMIVIEQKAETSYGIIVNTSLVDGTWYVKRYDSYIYDVNTKQETYDAEESDIFEESIIKFELTSIAECGFNIVIYNLISSEWKEIEEFQFKLDGNLLIGIDYDRPFSRTDRGYKEFSHINLFEGEFNESIIGALLELKSSSMSVELYDESEGEIYTTVYSCVKG